MPHAAIPKYAQLENERRFLVALEALSALSLANPRLIEDLYLNDSRLRLRRITPATGPAEFKLCKKYPSDDPVSTPITNLYLTETEHLALSGLPGRRIVKRRYDVAEGGLRFGVNVFEGALEGLILAEIETPDLASLAQVPTPAWALGDVTADPFFSGGVLAGVSQAKLRDALARQA